jgi:hypothetical protein
VDVAISCFGRDVGAPWLYVNAACHTARALLSSKTENANGTDIHEFMTYYIIRPFHAVFVFLLLISLYLFSLEIL